MASSIATRSGGDMSAGKLNKQVKIRAWQDMPAAAFGIEQTFDAGIDAWASIEPTKGSVYYGAKQTGNDVTHLIAMRISSSVREATVTPNHVIDDVTAGLRYRVKRSMDAKGNGRFLHVECELLGAIP
ncbi:head-tail adaptor protein [Noviherbaspirillum cavernae]|uniref:Head-tail adaptor protein n=1 Tax=Noviherbaspirillum cavernae TaxID=2320862 RepID=A0A418X1C3_9BURK|nr:phage head closure protein [Noviherbaspirillum cavernae]RJG06252.1 head-tail adaptor protein [Noviherbaspirillum cavernae]